VAEQGAFNKVIGQQTADQFDLPGTLARKTACI
jgi:hypothetical protein